nr:hypothetical protein Iba_chr11dCG12470 [Ipomoea batatas]
MSILNSEASPCDKTSKSQMHKESSLNCSSQKTKSKIKFNASSNQARNQGSSVQRYKPEINVQAINQGEETGGVPWLRRQERRWRTGLCPSGLWSGEARHEMEGWSLLVIIRTSELK